MLYIINLLCILSNLCDYADISSYFPFSLDSFGHIHYLCRKCTCDLCNADEKHKSLFTPQEFHVKPINTRLPFPFAPSFLHNEICMPGCTQPITLFPSLECADLLS